MTKDSVSSSLVVHLNVGGRKFCTYSDTLTRLEPNSMLATMFSGRHSLTQDRKGYIFIDRDGEYFGYILNWLRDGDVPTLEDSKYSQLLNEAQYFQLQGLIDGIHDVLKNKKEKLHAADLTRTDVIKFIQYETEYCNEWRMNSDRRLKFKGVNFSGLDLSGLDLSKLDFSYACMKNVCFSNANLTDSCFEHVDAEGANFNEANLKGSCFCEANLSGASVVGVKNSSPSFKFATLIGVDHSHSSRGNCTSFPQAVCMDCVCNEAISACSNLFAVKLLRIIFQSRTCICVILLSVYLYYQMSFVSGIPESLSSKKKR